MATDQFDGSAAAYGIARFIILGGIGALVFKPKQRITVTYERDV